MDWQIVPDGDETIEELVGRKVPDCPSLWRIEQEVRQAVGQTLDAVPVGSNTFNLCFESDWELETSLRDSKYDGQEYGVFVTNWSSEWAADFFISEVAPSADGPEVQRKFTDMAWSKCFRESSMLRSV
ncbi:MAG: hypothetical protein KDA68_20305 [Planctomycetaceae bacterium]|nr:hypothetical protein [Planctomycetaceae bacterium]